MQESEQAQVSVRAVFPHSLLLFDVPADMPKADLAVLIAGIGKGRGAPLSIKVILPPNPKARSRFTGVAEFGLS